MNNLWEYKKIGDVCIVERGGSPRPIDKYITGDKNGINWIKIGDTTDSMYITETAQKIIPEGMKKSRYVKPGDFLLSNSMSFGRPYILKIDGCIHDGWLVLRDEKGVFDKRFLYYYLSSKVTYKKFEAMAVGGVVNNLNKEMVRNVEVPIPNKNEQSNIANLLDKLNRILDNRKEELQQLDNLIKARFVEMFGTLHDNENGFEVVTIEDVCSLIKDGTHQTPQYTEDREEGFKFLSSKDVMSQKIDWTDIKYIPAELHKKLYATIKPQRNDILMSKNGVNYGVAAVNDTNEVFDIYVSLALLRPKEIIDPVFFRCAINNPETKKQFDSSIKGIGVPNLHLGEIKKTKIFLPPMEFQKKFVAFVEQVDKSKVTVQKALEQTQTLFDSLMQKYFG